MAEVEKETEIQWVKYGSSAITCLLGKDIIVICNENFITFVETSRPEKKELTYSAHNEVRGDGVRCLCTHKTLPCFAFAEFCRNPRIFIISYPSFEIYKTFESVTDTNYIALKFSEMEYLVALTGIPDYKIVVWNWRTSEKVFSQETQLEGTPQILMVSLISPVQIIQATHNDRKILFWDMNVCYKKTFLNKTTVELPESSVPPYAFAFGADGDLYFVDSQASLYSISSESRACNLQLTWKEDSEDRFTPCITWHKGGVVFTGPGEVQFWKRKAPEGWSKIWSFSPTTSFKNLFSSFLKDVLIGINKWNEIIAIKGEHQVELVTVKSFGSDFDFLCFVYPVGDYIATFGNTKKVFTVWNKINGQKMSQYLWTSGIIRAFDSNPKFPYLVAATEEGSAHIINVYDPNVISEMDSILLNFSSLDAVRFSHNGSCFSVANTDIGEFFLLRLPAKLEVIAYLKIDLKVVDFSLVDKDVPSLQLYILPMSQLCCRSGQNILLYALEEKQKTFVYLKDVALPTIVSSFLPSPTSHKTLWCIPHRSRQVYVMNLNGKVLHNFVSGHQMKLFFMKCNENYLLTYGVDGIVIIKVLNNGQCATVFPTHHRLNKGIKIMAFGPYMKYVVALGDKGSLVCTLIKMLANFEKKAENEALLASPAYKQLFSSEKFRSKTSDKMEKATEPLVEKEVAIEEKNVWLDMREQEIINMEEQQSRKEKQSIQEEFHSIKIKLRQLVDENYSNVPERQLPVHAFDLDKAARRKKLEDGKAEREKEKQLQLASMKNLNKITDIIKKACWDGVQVKGKELHGILAPVVVENYALLPDNPLTTQKMTWLPERIRIEEFFRKGDFFEPWVPRSESALLLHINTKFEVSLLDVTHEIKTKFEAEQMEEAKAKAKSAEQSQKFVWTGTSSHNFVEVDPNHFSQFELTTFLQSHQEIQLIETDIKKLMLWFNKEFEETFALKEREMAFVYERNNRFRHIINELDFFHFSPAICKTQIYDPQWAPQEDPDSIMTVADSEINVPMYITDSQLELMKKKEQEEERIRQLLLADDFRERALMAMMDGVLEKLWEDEIKKDVPKPRCMVEKEPEAYTEDDLKAIRAYEEAVKVLAAERERYRKILETEWSKTIINLRDNVSKFDEKVIKLQVLKLKVESAIGQEILKCLRIRQRCFQRIEMDRKKELLKTNITKNEKKIEAMTAELNKLFEILNDCRNYYETLQNKDRNLDKNFKREFPEYSPIVCEQLYKLSKKRPKMPQKAATFSTILIDMGKCAVSDTKLENMPSECIQYLKDLDALDAYSNAPASVSQQSWELACKLKRVKIDCELKMRACAIDLAEAETTVANYQKTLKATKERQTQLQNQLQALRAEKLQSSLNYQVQLVMKKGLVEIPLSGHIADFAECALVTKDTLNVVNKAINKMGQQKIKAMQKAANFRKGIIYKEWEHKKLRMEIEDLKGQLETVEKLQVLKELQAILVARARGFPDEKGFLYIENQIVAAKEKFEKNLTEIFSKIDDLNSKIDKITALNHQMDEKIVELNVEVNELNMSRDKDFDKKHLKENQKRMKKVRERSKMVRTIQQQHNEILVLQTELELLRLKTYPAIKYKIT